MNNTAEKQSKARCRNSKTGKQDAGNLLTYKALLKGTALLKDKTLLKGTVLPKDKILPKNKALLKDRIPKSE